MVLILLHVRLSAHARRSRRPDLGGARGTRAAVGDRRRSRRRSSASTSPLAAVPRVPREHLPRRLRDDDHRPAARQRHHPRERRRDARADVLRDDRCGRRRRPRRARSRGASATRRSTSGAGSFGIVIYAMPVFLLGLDGAALLRLVPRLVTGGRPGAPTVPAEVRAEEELRHAPRGETRASRRE